MSILGEIIQFPKELVGRSLALFTETTIYIGTVKSVPNFGELHTISLDDVVVLPIGSNGEGSYRLETAFVVWEKIVAIGPGENFQITYPTDN